jgi:DNA-binding FrmR family transcriptional regulator
MSKPFDDVPVYGDSIKKLARRIVGQMMAVERMLEEGRCCRDVSVQLAAVRGMMDKLAYEIAKDRMEKCPGDERTSEDVMREIVRLFRRGM